MQSAPKTWLDAFSRCFSRPGWVAQFVMMGPDDPAKLVELTDCFSTLDEAREYNREVLRLVNAAGKREKLRATLKGDLKTTHPRMPDYGMIACKEWTAQVLANLLGEKPNEAWVGGKP